MIGRQHTFAVKNLSRDLILPCNPCITDVEKRSHGKHATDNWNTVFHIHYTLSVATDVDHIIERSIHGVSGFRIEGRNGPYDVSNRPDLAEVKSADIEVAAQEKPLVIRNRCSAATRHKGTEEPNSKRIAALVHRMEEPVVHRRPEIVNGAAEGAARIFKRGR